MVSYYNHAAMYRHQQAVAAQQQFHTGSPMPWYPSYHHQNSQTAATPSYCMQEEQMWHHAQPPHPMFHHEFNEFVHAGISGQHPQIGENENTQLPSPPITVSGSEMSSPGAGGNISPASTQHTRPAPVRSPYEWIKKTSYQTQPNPGKTRTKDKYRVVYTDHQRVELEKEFYYSRYITIRRKAELASNLGLSERQVKIWFQNRRAKERKQVKKREEFTQKDTVTAVTMQLQQQQQNLLHSATTTTAAHNHHQTQLPNSVVHSVPVPLI